MTGTVDAWISAHHADPALGYAALRSFTPVITERLQSTRVRLLDLYGAPSQIRQAELRQADIQSADA